MKIRVHDECNSSLPNRIEKTAGSGIQYRTAAPAQARVHNPGREVRFPGKFPVPGTVRDAFPGPGFWLPGFQIQKSKSQIFWSKTNPGITVAVM